MQLLLPLLHVKLGLLLMGGYRFASAFAPLHPKARWLGVAHAEPESELKTAKGEEERLCEEREEYIALAFENYFDGTKVCYKCCTY